MNCKNKQNFRERLAGNINPENPLIRGILIQTFELTVPIAIGRRAATRNPVEALRYE